MKHLTIFALIALSFCSTSALYAQDFDSELKPEYGIIGEEPVIEHRPDRVLIFPQRMALDENTSVMDLLMMFPEALNHNFQDIDEKYVVRVENFNYEADQRVFLTTLKAKYVQKIQICDNPDVMKGSKGINGGVIDINMVRGAMENDIYIGAEIDTKGLSNTPIANAVYGNGKTDVLVTASLSDPSMKGEYGSTARCATKVNQALNDNHNLMYDFAARYGHNNDDIFTSSNSRYYGSQIQYDGVFNEAGTALSVSGGWEYYDDGAQSSVVHNISKYRTREVWQVYIVELWTPLFEGLELTAGWELDYANTSMHNMTVRLDDLADNNINNINSYDPSVYGRQDPHFVTYNNDFYAQLDYTVGPLSLTLGDRVMCYHYGMGDEKIDNPYNLIVASAILTPNWHHQIQGSYYRRFNSPDYINIHNVLLYSDFGQSVTLGNKNLDYQPADVYRVMYTYSAKKFWISIIGRYIDTRDRVIEIEVPYNNAIVPTFVNDPASYSNTNIDAAATFAINKSLSFNVGASYFNQSMSGNDIDYFYARISPLVTLPGNFKINAQAIWCSDKTPEKLSTDTDVYTMLAVQKTFGKHLTIAAQWHDILCSDLSAGNFKVTYRF